MAPSCHVPISRGILGHANCRIMWFADWSWNDTQSSQTPHSLIWSMTPIVWFAASCHMPHPLICRWTVECQLTEKRQIPWNVASFDLSYQSMERYRGWNVSMDGAHLGWLVITVDLLQFRRRGIINNSRLFMQLEWRLLPLAALSKYMIKGRSSELCSAVFLCRETSTARARALVDYLDMPVAQQWTILRHSTVTNSNLIDMWVLTCCRFARFSYADLIGFIFWYYKKKTTKKNR